MRPALGRNLSLETKSTPEVPMETRAGIVGHRADAAGRRGIVAAAARNDRALRHVPGLGHGGRQPAGRIGAFRRASASGRAACRWRRAAGLTTRAWRCRARRCRGIGHVGGIVAGHAEADVVLRAAAPWPPCRRCAARASSPRRASARYSRRAGCCRASGTALGSRVMMSSHSLKERASFHRITGPEAPCRPHRGGWRHAAGPRGRCPPPPRSPWVFTDQGFHDVLQAFHQSSGFCSDQPGCGRETFQRRAGRGDDLLTGVDEDALDR